MIAIDLSTMINKALEISGQETLIYIGHSQGTIMGFGAFPLQPDLASKVDLFIGLAPVAFVGNQESLLLDFLAELDAASWLAFFGEEEFLPSDWIVHFIAGSLCKQYPELCADVVFLLCGFDVSNLNDSRYFFYLFFFKFKIIRIPFYIDHTPAGTSVRNIWHWVFLFLFIILFIIY
jgi:lysosomal acid lipase/cholesteryl ester hydrolase